MLVCPKCGSTYTREQEHCGLDGTKLVQSDADPLIGQTIDKYRIEGRLGSGGMATVYRARHQFLDKDYAIKVLHGQIAADSTMARRFQREAKTLGQIKHPNVVSVDNFGATEAGLLYMVMEFLDGVTLGQALRQHSQLEPARAADVVRQIATGLQAAHRKGFVHRDLKPGNVMLVTDEVEGEVVKLMDFGLVRILSPDDTHTQLTQEGQFFGTPMYMAPEQITGHPVGPAADLYALGVMLHQMLAGQPPFSGDIKKLAFQHVQTAPPTLTSSFGGLSELSQQMMAKSPAKRPADATAVIARIDELALTPVSRPMRLRKPAPAGSGGPSGRDTDPDGGRRDPALSRPILQEERAFRTAHEADGELLRRALGPRGGRARWLGATFVLISAGAAVLYVANGQKFELEALQAMLPVPGVAKEAPTSPTAGERLGAEASGAKTPTPPPIDAPPSDESTPEGVNRASGNDAGALGAAASDAGSDLDAGVVLPESFAEMDAALTAVLDERHLSLNDLARWKPRSVDLWRRWREAESDGEELSSTPRLQRVFSQLLSTGHNIIISRGWLRAKLDRIDRDLRVLKAIGAASLDGDQQAKLQSDLDAFKKKSRGRLGQEELMRLAADTAALERAIAEAEAGSNRGEPSAEAEPPATAPPQAGAPSKAADSSKTAAPPPATQSAQTSSATPTSTSTRAAP